MVIWLYAIISNEAELLPYFLRHYAPWIDRMIFYDNRSADNSRDLIRCYPNADVKDYPADRPVLDSAEMALFAEEHYKQARGRADWVIWVDGDEFLWSGQVKILDRLKYYRQKNIYAIKAQGYQMISDHFPTGDAPIVEQITTGIRDAEYDKLCAFDPLLNVRFSPGRHNYHIANYAAYQSQVKLLHYRFLGEPFFRRRNAYLFANRSEAERDANRTYHSDPNHVGKYSAEWFRDAQSRASDVITQDWIGV